MAVSQSLDTWLMHCDREQAPSHILDVYLGFMHESVVIPLHLKHHFIHRRRQVAVLALCAQAQAQVA